MSDPSEHPLTGFARVFRKVMIFSWYFFFAYGAFRTMTNGEDFWLGLMVISGAMLVYYYRWVPPKFGENGNERKRDH